MRTRIISAFPGTGKTFYHNLHKDTTLDSDSSLFSWIETAEGKIRNSDFPANYIQHIKENIGKYQFIFVSSHKEVRDALLANCLFFYLVFPDEMHKAQYIKKYQDRGSPESFVNLISNNWEKWLKECRFCEIGCKQIEMVFENLDKELQHIVASESGDK